MESSYPIVNTLAEGTDWTFGRAGSLQVALIRVERDRVAESDDLPEADALAREIWRRAKLRDPEGDAALLEDVSAGLQQVLVDAGATDAATRAREFEKWAAEG